MCHIRPFYLERLISNILLFGGYIVYLRMYTQIWAYICGFELYRFCIDKTSFLVYFCFMYKKEPAYKAKKFLQVRVTSDEKRQLYQMTKSLGVQYPGVTMSGLVRHCVFGKGILSGLEETSKEIKNKEMVGMKKKKKKKRR